MAFSIVKPAQRVEFAGRSRLFKGYANVSTTYTKGDPVVITNGLVAAAAASGTDVVGVVAETLVSSAAAVAGVEFVKIDVGFEVPIYRANINNLLDDAVVTALHTDYLTMGFATGLTYGNAAVDNSIRYSTAVIYAGKGKGEYGLIGAYDAAGHAMGVSQAVTMVSRFRHDPDTTSYVGILGTGTDAQGVYPGSQINLSATAYQVDGSTYTGPYWVWSLEDLWAGVVYLAPRDALWKAP